MKRKILFIFLLMFWYQAFASERLDIADVSRSNYTLHSKILGETRSLLIKVPSSYENSNKNYPVLYLLDGERHFDHSILASKLLSEQNKIPELIIVAILNGEVEGSRTRNLAIEKDKFANFIQYEVLNYVNSRFRTNNDNTIFGHSLAAYFSISMLANQPSVFNRFIAAGPPLMVNKREIFTKLFIDMNIDTLKNKQLFISSASEKEEGADVIEEINIFVQQLKEKSPLSFKWQYRLFEDESHITNYYISLFKGLSSVYAM